MYNFEYAHAPNLKTVIMVDSFGVQAIGNIIPYFADITFVHFDALTADNLISEINQADLVWVMSVERAVGGRFSDPPVDVFFSYATKDFLDAMSSRLELKDAN